MTAEIQSISNGSAITAAVVSGAVDVGFANVLSLASAHQRGVPITLIAPASIYTTQAPTSVLMVPNDSHARAAHDLDGKTIAVNGLKNITQLAPEAWLDTHGGDSKTVRFVEMPFPDMPLALTSHRVDAALVAEPVLTEARGPARVFAKAYDGIAPVFLIGAWFTSVAWAKQHPDLVRRFDDAMRATSQWANAPAHHERSADVLSRSTKLPPELVRRITRAKYAERLDPHFMQSTIDAAAKYAILSSSFPATELVFAP